VSVTDSQGNIMDNNFITAAPPGFTIEVPADAAAVTIDGFMIEFVG
jgi:hypothetical protein